MKKKIVTIAEAAYLGGQATKKKYGREHYVEMGRKSKRPKNKKVDKK